jgi:hypothetical protein
MVSALRRARKSEEKTNLGLLIVLALELVANGVEELAKKRERGQYGGEHKRDEGETHR